MKMKKKFVILLIIFGALILAAVVKKTVFKSKAFSLEKADEAGLVELIPKFAGDFISKITVYKGNDPENKVVFSKNTLNEWTLENSFGIRAINRIPEELVKSLSGLKGELRADSQDVFSDFQIADNQGMHIVLLNTAGKEVAHAVIGLKMLRWDTNAVRLFGANKIIAAQKNLLMTVGFFDPKSKLMERAFADFRVFPGELNNAKRIEIKLGAKRPLLLKKIEGGPAAGWQFDPALARFKIEPAKVDEFLRILSGLSAQDIVSPKISESYGLNKPAFTIALDIKNGDALVSSLLEFGSLDKTKKAYYARLTPQNIVYLIPQNSADNLKKDKTFFLQRSK